MIFLWVVVMWALPFGQLAGGEGLVVSAEAATLVAQAETEVSEVPAPPADTSATAAGTVTESAPAADEPVPAPAQTAAPISSETAAPAAPDTPQSQAPEPVPDTAEQPPAPDAVAEPAESAPAPVEGEANAEPMAEGPPAEAPTTEGEAPDAPLAESAGVEDGAEGEAPEEAATGAVAEEDAAAEAKPEGPKKPIRVVDINTLIATLEPEYPEEAPKPSRDWATVKNPKEYEPSSIANGNLVYHDHGLCHMCHGEKGDGFGPVRIQFTPYPNAFFTEEWHAARSDGEIMGVLTDGKFGTGMISLVPEFLSEDEAWDVINYLRSLKGKTSEEYEEFQAQFVTETEVKPSEEDTNPAPEAETGPTEGDGG